MADISQLGGMQPVEALDLENYADQKDYVKIPAKGRYTVQAPPEFPREAFDRAKTSKALTARVDPKIVSGPSEGYTVRFTNPSAKTYKRNGITVSQVGDYLRAHGMRTKLTDEQAIADAVEATANRVFQVDLNWKAYNKATGFSVEGMENFPSDGNGGHLPFIDDPTDFVKDEVTGEDLLDAEGNRVPVRLRANVFVERYVAQV